jgi:hypothetical protein
MIPAPEPGGVQVRHEAVSVPSEPTAARLLRRSSPGQAIRLIGESVELDDRAPSVWRAAQPILDHQGVQVVGKRSRWGSISAAKSESSMQSFGSVADNVSDRAPSWPNRAVVSPTCSRAICSNLPAGRG